MGKKTLAVVASAVLGLTQFAALSARAAQEPPPPPPPGYGNESWAVAPPEYQGAERKGFFDGVEGARKDYQNHRMPDVENRDEYRHPPVHRDERGAYRRGFRHGYAVGVNNLMHPGTPYPGV